MNNGDAVAFSNSNSDSNKNSHFRNDGFNENDEIKKREHTDSVSASDSEDENDGNDSLLEKQLQRANQRLKERDATLLKYEEEKSQLKRRLKIEQV